MFAAFSINIENNSLIREFSTKILSVMVLYYIVFLLDKSRDRNEIAILLLQTGGFASILNDSKCL